jgi:hypothetical protein
MDIWSVVCFLVGLIGMSTGIVLFRRHNKNWKVLCWLLWRMDRSKPDIYQVMSHMLNITFYFLVFMVGLIIDAMVILL